MQESIPGPDRISSRLLNAVRTSDCAARRVGGFRREVEKNGREGCGDGVGAGADEAETVAFELRAGGSKTGFRVGVVEQVVHQIFVDVVVFHFLSLLLQGCTFFKLRDCVGYEVGVVAGRLAAQPLH